MSAIEKNKYGFYIRTCILLVGIIFFPAFIASLLFIVNISIGNFTFLSGIVLLLILYWLAFYDTNHKRDFYLPIVTSFVLASLSIALSSILWDLSWDGWSYHIPSVIYLSDGWNPVYQHCQELKTWSVHYPKFIWTYGASLYVVSGNMFLGTSFNTIILFATFFLCMDILTKSNKFSKRLTIIMSIIISANAVLISQLFTYYNDGVLGNCIICLILILYAVSKKYYEYQDNYIVLFLIAAFTAILANIKFNGALIAVIILILFFVHFIIKRIIKADRFMVITITVILLSTLIVAANSYLPNIIYHKNPGYPIIGENKRDIITGHIPKVYENDNKYIALFKSLTTETAHSAEEYNYKPAYIVSNSEIEEMAECDTKCAGFGPYFQLILWGTLLAGICALILKLKNIITKQKCKTDIIKAVSNYDIEILVMIIFVIMILTNPAPWWPRYIPYFYVVPLLAFIMFKKQFKIRGLSDVLIYFVIVVYALCIPQYLAVNVNDAYMETVSLKTEIAVLQEKSEKEPIDIACCDYKTNYYKMTVAREMLNNNDINFLEYDEKACVQNIYYCCLGISEVTPEISK